MKNLLFILLLIVFFSCKKEDTFCWDCYTKDNITDIAIDSAFYCNMTVEEIHQVEMPKWTPMVSYRICYNRKWIK